MRIRTGRFSSLNSHPIITPTLSPFSLLSSQIISTVNHAQAVENSCSPYHPDDVSADAEEGHPANPVLPYKEALDLGIQSLDMAVKVRTGKKHGIGATLTRFF
jgi:hypothetical protein